MNYPDEWTQKEFLQNRQELKRDGIEVVLVDTILSEIEKTETIKYNPFELKKYKNGTIFVFYCDTGKASLARLQEYKDKFPEQHCISLNGGRGYWRKNMTLIDENPDDK